MEFKHLNETELKHHLNKALNDCLEKEEIKIKNGEELAHNRGLEHSYYELLNLFEEHIKSIIKANKEI